MGKYLCVGIALAVSLTFGSVTIGNADEQAPAPGASVPTGEMSREEMKAEKKEMKKMKRMQKEQKKQNQEKEGKKK